MHLWVFDQTWREVRKPVLFWAAALAALVLLFLALHPLLAGLARSSWPLWLGEFFPVTALASLQNWIWQVLAGWIAPLLAALFAVGLGSWLVAGEEERGSLGFLLAAPVRRDRLILEKMVVLAAALLLISAGIVLAVLVALFAAAAPVSALAVLRFAPALYLFGLSSGGLALALACWTGMRRLSQNIAALALLLSLLAARLPDALPVQSIHWISPFFYYDQWLQGSSSGLLLLGLLCLMALLAAWLGFVRRDFRERLRR